MNARSRVVLTERDNVVTLRGFRGKELVLEAGVRPLYLHGGWTFDAKRLPDVTAYLDYRNVRYRFENTTGDGAQ